MPMVIYAKKQIALSQKHFECYLFAHISPQIVLCEKYYVQIELFEVCIFHLDPDLSRPACRGVFVPVFSKQAG